MAASFLGSSNIRSPIRPVSAIASAAPRTRTITPTFGDISKRTGIQQGITSQLANLGGQAGAAAGQRTGEFGALMPGYSSLLDSGYSPTEKSAINQSTLGAIGSAYGSAEGAAGRRMARTGNTAGYGSFMGALARGKGRDLAAQNLQNQRSFADEQLRRKMMGLEGIANLYGVDTSFLNSMLGQQGQMIGQGVNTYGISSGKKGFGDILGGSFASGLGSLLTLH